MLGFMPGPLEILLLCLVGVLIFGKRLPEVGKNLGKGIIEFKKGLSGIEEDINKAGEKPTEPPKLDQRTSASIDTPQDRAPATSDKDSKGA